MLGMMIGALFVGILGAVGHSDAKEKNAEAERIAAEAQNIYNSAKFSLNIAKKRAEEHLLKLGYSKKKVLDTSMKSFLNSFDKIKHIPFPETIGLSEVSDLKIDAQGVMQVREMINIYDSSVKSGATGAVAGVATNTMLTLAASGSFADIGLALAVGNLGGAVSTVTSAMATTPLAMFVAPVVLFTGISASIKADENLEKAKTMHAEAERAKEEMELSVTLCAAISERADMFNDLLLRLDKMFSECANMLANVIRKKEGIFKRKIQMESLSENDIKLSAVTHSLAGAVKMVLETPIITPEGTVSDKSAEVCENSPALLHGFEHDVEMVRVADYNAPVQNRKPPVAYANANIGGNRSPRTRNQGKNKGANMSFIDFMMWYVSVCGFFAGFATFFALESPITSVSWMLAGVCLFPPILEKMKTLKIVVGAILFVIGGMPLM